MSTQPPLKKQKKKPAPKTADPDVCPYCHRRNTAGLCGKQHECHDCGGIYVPVASLKGTGSHEYAFDAEMDVVIRVTARNESEARKKVKTLNSITIAHYDGDCYISEGSVIEESLSCFSVDSNLIPERESPCGGHAKMLERIKKGPQKGQSRGQMLIELGHAVDELQKTGSFGGGMLWSGVVALYEQALGYPITPKVTMGDQEFDLSTVVVTESGFNVKMRKS